MLLDSEIKVHQNLTAKSFLVKRIVNGRVINETAALANNAPGQQPRTAQDYHELYKSGRTTPLAVLNTILSLTEWTKDSKGEYADAFIYPDATLVREAAKASTQRYRDKRPLGVLDGVPVGVNIELDVAGLPRSPTLWHYTHDPKRSSDCVRIWQAAGAIVVGRLNMHQFGMSNSPIYSRCRRVLGVDSNQSVDIHENSSIFGEASLDPSPELTPRADRRPTPRHPYDEKYYAGGTFGGSGAAVALGLVVATLSGDAGGSVCVPASYAGLCGLKPSHGSISDAPVVTTSAVMGGTTGIVTSNIEDMRLFYDAAVGKQLQPSPARVVSSSSPGIDLTQPGRRQRTIGICSPWFARADESVLERCLAACSYLVQHRGFSAVEVNMPCPFEGQIIEAIRNLRNLDVAIVCDDVHSSNSNSTFRYLVNHGYEYSRQGAEDVAGVFSRHCSALFQRYPGMIIAVPTVPDVGWPVQAPPRNRAEFAELGKRSLRGMEFTWLAGLTGLPALTMPVGLAEPDHSVGEKTKGLPIGLMGMAEWNHEDDLFAWGAELEKYANATGSKLERPPKWVDCIARTLAAPNEEI